MKYLSILLGLIFAFTLMGMDNYNQSELDAQDKTEATETEKKSCDKHKCCKNKSESKEENKKDCCKKKCDQEGKKCENCGKCESKCECKKECKRKDDHKCGEGKCGGDTKE